MIDKSIVDRIKKCFALSGNNPEPEEAASALAMARKLMDEYGIKQKDIDMSRVRESYTKIKRDNPSTHEVHLANIIGGAFGCICIYKSELIKGHYRTVVNFIGLEPNAEIASYAYTVLFRKLTAARNDYMKKLKRYSRMGKIRAMYSYSYGWTKAVFAQIQKLIPETEVPAIVEDYYLEKYPDVIVDNIPARKINLGHKKEMDKHLTEGYIAGLHEQVHHPMSGSGSDQELLS